MKTSVCALARSLAVAAGLVATAALAPQAALAAGGHGFAGASHAGGGWHGGGGAGWHGGGGAGWHGGGGRGYYGGHRGWGRPGVFWGGVGLGLGVGAVGYYNGWWSPYGYSSYPVYADSYYYDAAPPVLVSPGDVVVDPTARYAQPVPQPARAPEPIFYPNKGQSAATTENDRRDCNRWATTQSGAMADASIFQRATYACMEGRGYTVK